jgi:hypothetical protein
MRTKEELKSSLGLVTKYMLNGLLSALGKIFLHVFGPAEHLCVATATRLKKCAI